MGKLYQRVYWIMTTVLLFSPRLSFSLMIMMLMALHSLSHVGELIEGIQILPSPELVLLAEGLSIRREDDFDCFTGKGDPS